MKIINPSNKAIENVRIFGVLYSIEAEGTLENVPEAHARYWQELHKFLVLRKDKLEDVTKVETKLEIPTPFFPEVKTEEVEEIEEVVEEEEEVVEETPEVAPVVISNKGKGKGKNK